ncbi:hypothetical protein MYX77_14525, partial [Acidobacteriia bacterium AH_259_A11_L15]|nr:hypothetical protein [Acidobacteriia bacterium AH_259_A11_L15]
VMLDEKAGTPDLWIYEIERGIRTRFTFDPGTDWAGAWSPDGKTIFFSSDRNGNSDIFRKSFAGSSPEELLLEKEGDQYAFDVSS